MQVIAPKTHAKIAPDVFAGLLWTFVALTTCFLFARLAIKLKMFGRLLWDDFLVILAWLLFLAYCIVWKLYIHLQYEQYEVLQGKRPFDQTAINHYDQFLGLVVPQNILFYSGLWAVKFSFLAFFYRLVEKIRNLKIWWWCVLVITAGCYVGSVADIQWECTTPVSTVMWVLQNCGTLEKIHWVNRTFYVNCAIDVLTDCLILTIPISILWNTRIPLRKKIILFSVFGATIGVMIISIIRVAVVASANQNVEIIWLYFWSTVETGIAIVIVNIVSFRQLFVANTEASSTKGFFSFSRTPLFKRSWGRSYGNGSSAKAQEHPQKSDPTRTASEEAILPLEFITVQRAYDVTPAKWNRASSEALCKRNDGWHLLLFPFKKMSMVEGGFRVHSYRYTM